jgi:REP element-mobilizing transposase RayT
MHKTNPIIKPDKFRNKYRIQSARQRNWDYRSKAVYYFTICTQNHLHYFGNIEDGKMILSETGQIATTHWFDIPKHFPFIELINFVVMPNHNHGLVEINDNPVSVTVVETLHATSLQRSVLI